MLPGDSADFQLVFTVVEDCASRLSKIFADASLQLFDTSYATKERAVR
ncbi:hypothetical protein [Actinomadura coerulea]|nr:hypothetical protein [Actinomadura coerulea]